MFARITEWLDREVHKGIYRGPFKKFVGWCDSHLSLNGGVKRCVRNSLKLDDEGKTPEWVSEVYQLFSLGCAITLLVLARVTPTPVSFIVGLLALYRPFEIFLFALSWVFIHQGPLHSYKRSLVGFLVNLAEVVIFYAAAYVAFGFVGGKEPLSTALYSSVRISVTIGPVATTSEPPESVVAGILVVTQIVVSYFLIVISVANVVGALRSRGEFGK